MSENWRRKTYYQPRVLVSTEHVLTPQFDDTLICLTGSELEMLRNLTQYLHRRSTFVSEYEPDHYLAPDNDEWDALQAIVASLEDKLMGCPEITTLLEDILAAAQCICNKASVPPSDMGTVAPVVTVLLEDGTLIEDDPYSLSTEIEARRCAVAQLTTWQALEWLTEIIQPLQENAADVIVPATLGVISVLVGVTPLAIPAGAVIAFVSLLIDVWVDGSLQDVVNAVFAHREELICAVYQGLSYDYRMAETRAAETIDDISELSPIDRILLKASFAPWAIALASKAYTAGTDWALANVQAGACDDCGWVVEFVYEFPPCPGVFTGGFPCAQGRWPGLNANEFAYSPTFTLPSIGTNIDIEIETHYTSKFSSGWTVGYSQVEYQDAGLNWVLVGQNQHHTDVITGGINKDTTLSEDKTVTRNVLRINMHGQPGQGDTNPWPFMPMYVRIKIYPHV